MQYIKQILMISVLCGMLGAAPEAADALYAQGEWQAALTAYEQQSVRTPGLCIRMGDCAYALKEYPKTWAYWYEALRGLYFLMYYEISVRIMRLEAQIGLGSSGTTPVWIMATALASIPPVFWQMIALIAILLFLFKLRRLIASRAWYMLCLMGIVIGGLGAAALASVASRTLVGAIATASVPILSGPDKRFSEVGMLSSGLAVKCLGTAQVKNGPVYYKIQSAQRRGWVEREKLIVIGEKTQIHQ
jgi:hypothetical protein